MHIDGFVGYWWKFVTSPEFQEEQAWMQPVMRFFGILPPNAWTLMRIPGGAITFWLVYNGLYISALLSFLFFILTDWADGKSARFRGQVTANGGILDGTADKFLVHPTTGLLVWMFLPQCYSYWGVIVPTLFLLMVITEVSRILMPLSKRFDKETHLHAILYGKYKLGVQAILVILLWLAVFIFPGWPWWPIWISLFLVAALVLSVFSIIFRLYPELERFAADIITLGNFSCGVLAILFAMRGEFKSSIALILIAGTLDMADGFVARKTKPPKEKSGLSFGDIADDIGDFVSFAVAPAAILYFLDKPIAAVIYLVATITRLIFFTYQGIRRRGVSGVFQGVPSPAAAIFFGSFLFWEHSIPPETIAIIAMVLATLEVAFFARWYHFRMIFKIPVREQITAGISGAALFFFVGSGEALSSLSILYLIFFFQPIANRNWDWNKN